MKQSTDSNFPVSKRGMQVEATMFFLPVLFFFPIGISYGFVSDWEPIGTLSICALGGMFAFAGGYLWLTSRRIDFRPSDDPDGEIAEGEGELGDFNPNSWWPLVAGIAATIVAAGLAIGWWMFAIGAVVGIVALIGYAFENSRGIYAH